MKVGTDGVLVGAWSPLNAPRRILDIGTGSGLIALMLAQRFTQAEVYGIDIDESAIMQARENAEASPFSARVHLEHVSLEQAPFAEGWFDAIVCNPPFYEEDLLPPEEGRCNARHTTSLPFDTLISRSSELLSAQGQFCVIIPSNSFESFHRLCFEHGLFLQARCLVKTSARRAPKRILVCYSKTKVEHIDEQHLTLNEGNARSREYAQLTADFYLH